MVKKITILSLLLIIILTTVNLFLNKTDKNLSIIAHRGGLQLLYPENSLIAFQNATKYTDFIEMNIQFTKDHQPLVIHDATLNRTTNCIGKIEDKTYNELKSCRLRTNIYSAVGEQKIPHFQEIIQKISIKKTILIVEIKTYDEIGIKNLMHLVQNHGNIYIQSFSLKILNYLFKKYQLHNLYLIANKLPIKYPDFLAGFILNKNHIDANILKKMDSRKKIFIWTVDDTIEFLKFSNLEIDGLMTNDIRFFSKKVKD